MGSRDGWSGGVILPHNGSMCFRGDSELTF